MGFEGDLDGYESYDHMEVVDMVDLAFQILIPKDTNKPKVSYNLFIFFVFRSFSFCFANRVE